MTNIFMRDVLLKRDAVINLWCSLASKYKPYWLDRGKLEEWASLLNVNVSKSMSDDDIKTALVKRRYNDDDGSGYALNAKGTRNHTTK